MPHVPTQHLNEQWRDAMLAFYLATVLPEDKTVRALGLADSLTTAEDVYGFWLLDPQISQAVLTTRIASAIASLQQYIHALYLGLEPGYERQGMSPAQETSWRDSLSSYALWRAGQQLRHYPASYLDPTLRHDKSDSFKQLENELNQFQIQPEPLLNAVQGYLNRFEELANLKTLNGYIDGDKDHLANSVYYFTGKSSAENTYYWRSLDMSQRLPHTPDTPSPTAWSGWKKIHLAISENVPEHTIRPVFFNGRLFVVWAQCINPVSSSGDTTPFLGLGEDESQNDFQRRLEAHLKSHYLQFRLNVSYMKFDGSWSAPQACIQEYCVMSALHKLSLEDLMKATSSIAILDSRTHPPSLFLGISAHPGNQHRTPHQDDTNGRFFQAVRLDQHLNIQWLESIGSPRVTRSGPQEPELAKRYLTLFAHHNKLNFHFRAPETAQVKVKHLTTDAPNPGTHGWDYEGNQRKISDLSPDTDIQFNTTTSVLEVTARLTESFDAHRIVVFDAADALVTLQIILSTGDSIQKANGAGLLLDATSAIALETIVFTNLSRMELELSLKCNKTGVSLSEFIHDETNSPVTSFISSVEQGETRSRTMHISLAGNYITQEAFDYFFNTSNSPYTLTLRIYNRQESPRRHMRDLILANTRASQAQRLYKPVLMFPKQRGKPLPHSPHRGNTVLVDGVEISRRDLRENFTELPKAHRLNAQIELDPKTLRPYDENGDTAPPGILTLIHGVLILKTDLNFPDPMILGYALKTATFELDTHGGSPVIPLAPGIRHLTSAPYGTAEFIDFSGSIIETADDSAQQRAPIRTNTCVAGLLTKTASSDLHRVFSLPMDTWREPPLATGLGDTALDFHGAHGRYFWELFLYLPWLLAQRLNLEQHYAQAEAWIRYLFDPARPCEPGGQAHACWRLPALLSSTPPSSYALAAPNDPVQLALSHPTYFRQALYLLYVDIQLNRGDAAYRQMTRDSLTEAKLWYVRTQRLIGPRPPVNPVDPWTPATLGTPGRLCRSLSPDLLVRWDKIDSRLYNLRHDLDVSGNPLNLPLFAAPLTPQALLAAYTQGSPVASTPAPARALHTSHYRFQVVLGHALQAVDNLTQLGNTLLSVFERKEQAHYQETQHQHAWDLASIAVEQQAQAQQYDLQNQQALEAGRRVIQGRVSFFEQQLKQGITPTEAQASHAYQQSASWESAAAVAQAGAGLAMLIPNIFGTANGGVRYEGAFHALQAAAQGVANEKRASAAHLDRSEQFARRAQEWAHALDQARLELAHVDAQLQAYAQHAKNTRLQLHLAQTSLAQARTMYHLLGKRFTHTQLYHWLNGQLAGLYFQAYDTTLSLCLTAQACWQEERAQWDRQFIQPHLWSNQYRGLTAGEALKQNLLAMSSAYLTHNERLLEISKTVSLRQLHDKDPLATADKPWATLKDDLVNNGSLRFELTLKLFNDDYPGHYLRRLKSVSVSLPATLGPYEDVKAVLTQTANATWLAPPSKAPDSPGTVKKDLRVRQEIALSSGLNDSGLFTLNFDTDERYLPFEYTGAVSSWQLTFPHHARQRSLLESLTDIIVHVRYTAKNSGGH
ncbi:MULTISPECIES: neuraminidase-like domain-containing protein [unclassified Pseudomonas]|uniref:Tc toxin subunit A-related protein n=1 Tax=unclassified Pseudomonas TaxID=196821 RepID=UPI0015A2759F|nr:MULTISPECIES: neuraminidase-like domain-containing protein [unclassified Pseudomonas]NWC93913.1 phage tail tape measure protein [Pseudomonas sp. IPO3779]NWD21146.1 phage tail tape measure protein [Pseudomonas sp. IPO3778]